MPVIRLPVHRNVMNLGADTPASQFGHKLRTRYPQSLKVDQHRVQVPSMRRLTPRSRTQTWSERLEQAVIKRSNFYPSTIKAMKLLQLTEAQSTQNIGQAIIPTKLMHLVVPRVG